MTLERLLAEGGTYSAAVATSGPGTTLHIAGKIAPGHELRTQVELVFDQISGDLEQFGGSLADLVQITVYLTSLDHYTEFVQVRRERLGDALPASVVVEVAGLLQGALIEIGAVACISA